MHKVDIEGALQAPLQLMECISILLGCYKIPESIGQLKHLEKIVLRGCHFHTQLPLETLPDEFCQMSSVSCRP
jgi:hypothetical protein